MSIYEVDNAGFIYGGDQDLVSAYRTRLPRTGGVH